jgi:hypothetical protein
MPELEDGPTYHDVVVIVDGTRYRIRDSYAYKLTCTRVGGWCLFYEWAGESRLIGGEYDSNEFVIEVRGVVVCRGATEAEDAPTIP